MAAETVHIYFGSQTGTAEGMAHDLGLEAQQLGIPAAVVDLERFDPAAFARQGLVVLLVATSGDGEPSDNAAAFHAWLTAPGRSGDALKATRFAVFGLGDRAHANFNRMGEVVDGCMERLGAERLCRRGIGDASGDMPAEFAEWQEVLWPRLQELCLGKAASMGDAIAGPVAELELRLASSVRDLPSEAPGSPADIAAKFYFGACQLQASSVVELLRNCSADDGESKAHVEFDVHGTPLAAYEAAGTLELVPENSPEDVAAMLPLLGLSEASKPGDLGDLDCCVTFVPAERSAGEVRRPFPTPCSLRAALSLYCDLRRPPSRKMLRAMLPVLDEGARERARRLLTNPKAMRVVHDEDLAWTQHEFWTAFGAERLDLAAFLLHCPRQRPRSYTVASSPLAAPGSVHICASMLSRAPPSLDAAVAALASCSVFLQGARAPPRPALVCGLASRWLCGRLRQGAAVLARLQPPSSGGFRLPSADVPLVMVCAGAGVAPFRALWQELQRGPPRTSPATLFFGCRHPDRDWLYREEMTAFAGEKLKVVTAFSRVGEEGVYDPSGCCGEYVQDQLRAHAEDIREQFSRGGVVFLCGGSRFGSEVLSCLGEVLGGSDDELQRWRREGRIVQESWGGAPAPLKLEELGFEGVAVSGDVAQADEEAHIAAALLEAVKNGQLAEVQRLIDGRADVNFQAGARKYTRIGLRQEVGETALHWAALRGDDATAELLLAAGAEANLRDQDGKTPLHIAAFNGSAGVAERLLSARCDPNSQDLRKNSALHWVVLAGGSMRMLRLLLKGGADPELANEEEDTAADIAEEQGSFAAATLLRK